MKSMTALMATAIACVASWSPVHAQESADRIWSGGPILTMNDEAMRAEAIAERDGRIVAVGSQAEVMRLRGDGTELIDLNGRALLPGFVDAHGHMVMGGLQALSANLLPVPYVESEDVTNAVLWLVSSKARHVTGVTLPVDAGHTVM